MVKCKLCGENFEESLTVCPLCGVGPDYFEPVEVEAKSGKVKCSICQAEFDATEPVCPVCNVGPEYYVPVEEAEVPMVKCDVCQAVFPADEPMCPVCCVGPEHFVPVDGQPVTAQVRCDVCHAVFSADEPVCPFCNVGPEHFVPVDQKKPAGKVRCTICKAEFDGDVENCPVCGGVTRIQRTADVETLYCTNPECQAKKIKSFALFVSRDAMNMEGMSEATLEKFIGSGFIHEFADIFRLSRYKDAIVEMEGFGEKSYEKLIAGIGQARNTTLPRLIYSIGIPNIGVANAKMICKAFDYDLEKIRTADAETMAGIDGIGEVIGAAVADYFRDAKKAEQLDDLLEEIHLEKYVPNETEQIFAGKNFVITGSLIHFANRNELKAKIEEKGGKVTGSVTSKTDYLINNDTQSSTSKNKKAKELEIPVISEEDFLGMLEQR